MPKNLQRSDGIMKKALTHMNLKQSKGLLYRQYATPKFYEDFASDIKQIPLWARTSLGGFKGINIMQCEYVSQNQAFFAQPPYFILQVNHEKSIRTP